MSAGLWFEGFSGENIVGWVVSEEGRSQTPSRRAGLAAAKPTVSKDMVISLTSRFALDQEALFEGRDR
jgi:hypothetical protein